MKEHARVTSTKPLKAQAPGDVTVGDIMFLEVKNGVKKPLMIHVDVFTKMIMGVPLNSKTETECARALLEVKAECAAKGKTIKQLVFNSEPGIVPSQEILNDNGTELILKAASQKVGLAEVSIRLIREKARATKAGVHSKFGYLPPNQFNVDRCLDSISVLNRIPKHDQTMTPFELMGGKCMVQLRDLHAEWGEPVVVKKPKGILSNLGTTGQWAMVVRRIMNGTGVIKVYLIQSKKYAYRLKFVQAIASEWVMEAMKNISADDSVGFEDVTTTEENQIQEMIAEVENHETKSNTYDDEINTIEEYEETKIMGGQDRETVVLKSIESIEDAWKKMNIKSEPINVDEQADVAEQIEPQVMGPVPYVTRSGRISRPPNRLIETAYAVVKETYVQNYQDMMSEVNQATIECTYAMKALLFQKALKLKPEEAMKALREEVSKTIKLDIWEPVHLESLTLKSTT